VSSIGSALDLRRRSRNADGNFSKRNNEHPSADLVDTFLWLFRERAPNFYSNRRDSSEHSRIDAGVGTRLKDHRPYKNPPEFRSGIAKYMSADELGRLERYLNSTEKRPFGFSGARNIAAG